VARRPRNRIEVGAIRESPVCHSREGGNPESFGPGSVPGRSSTSVEGVFGGTRNVYPPRRVGSKIVGAVRDPPCYAGECRHPAVAQPSPVENRHPDRRPKACSGGIFSSDFCPTPSWPTIRPIRPIPPSTSGMPCPIVGADLCVRPFIFRPIPTLYGLGSVPFLCHPGLRSGVQTGPKGRKCLAGRRQPPVPFPLSTPKP
jgi:hypothetical protein